MEVMRRIAYGRERRARDGGGSRLRVQPPELQPALFLDPRRIVRFGVPPFRIEIMTSIDGVQFDACRPRAR
jgi:hypothetical protein